MAKKKIKRFAELSPAKQIERWENVLRVLRALTPHERRRHWDMGVFGEQTDCGTVACAAGHCGLDTWFNRQGFRMTFGEDLWGSPETNLSSDGGALVEDFFGREGSREIFFDGTRRSVTQVIREVKGHIASLKEEAA